MNEDRAEKTKATVYEDAGLSVIRCGNLLVAAWRQAPTMMQMKFLGVHIANLHQDFGDEVGFVNLAVSGKPELITKEVREEANRLARRWHSLCSAHIVLVDGLAGVVVRSIFRAMVVISGYRGAWRVFSGCHDAAPWIAACLDGHAGLKWPAGDVERLLDEAASRAGG